MKWSVFVKRVFIPKTRTRQKRYVVSDGGKVGRSYDTQAQAKAVLRALTGLASGTPEGWHFREAAGLLRAAEAAAPLPRAGLHDTLPT